MRHSLVIFSVLALGLQSFSQPPHEHAVIRRIGIMRPNIVVLGANLSKVEIWAIPTGTGITPDQYRLLGTAKLQSVAGGQHKLWAFPIPPNPISATDIFAKGFDAKGKLVGTKSMREQGASSIYDALWGDRPELGPPQN